MRYLITCVAALWALSAQAVAPTEYHYGDNPLQTLDVYPSQTHHNTPVPIVLFVHGGAWLGGDKRDVTVIEPKRTYFDEHGGVLYVSVNYRLTPEADAYAQTWDVANAVKFVLAHARQWGGDTNRMILMGHSAGGHIVALLGANPSKFGLKPWRGTVALDSAAFNVQDIMTHKHFPYYDPAFGSDEDQWAEASPIDQLQKNATPFFLVCGLQGPFTCDKAQAFADKANAMGIYAKVRGEDLEHIEINDALGENGAYTDAVFGFMQHHLK